MSLISYKQLKEVLENLKDKIIVELNRKASLDRNNVFVGKNTFNELELTGKNVFVQTGGTNSGSFSAVGKYCGYRSVSTHRSTTTPQPVYVSAVKIEVADNLGVEDVVTGVYVVEVQKKANKVNDIVGEKFAENSSFIVEEDSSGTKVIYVPIEKTYTDDTYFLIGKNGRQEFKETFYSDPNDVATNSINGLDIDSLSSKGDELAHDRGIGWVTRHALTNGTVDVREELEALNNKFINAGTVSSVNNQSPVQGNITLDGTHIKLDGQNSQTVKQEIDTLKGRVDNCVTMVNGQAPINGEVTVNALQIRSVVGNTVKNVQDHMNEINNNLTTAGNSIRANALKANNNENRILLLERKHPVYHVGDIVTTVYKDSNTYVADDFEFIYIGASRQLINRDKYGDLFNALGVSASVNSIYAPEISDINLTYNINQTAKRRHYICARKIR